MKINKTTIIATLGSMTLALAFFAMVGIKDASACGSTVCQYPPLVANCLVSNTHVKVGDVVTWTTEGEGGNGYYSFYWYGDDGLESDYQTVSIRYMDPGVKTGTIEITSNNETISRTCSVTVEDDYVPPRNKDLEGSCKGTPSRVDEDERVTWTATARGGDGDYEYEWSGTDNLDGDDKSITKRYNDSGTKTARVKITSDGESITRTCTVKVDNDKKDDNDDLDAYCKASPSDAKVGDRIKWTVYPDGGNGRYTYDWDGDDNLNGDDKSITKTYNTAGRKEAEVTVKSDGDRKTVRCYADIEKDRTVVVPPQTDGGIYLSSIPATGISPTMKVSLFVAGLFMWSAFLSYLYIARRNEKIKEKAILQSLGE